MKIGIVTFYRSLNYGAMLQAYSLLKCLENRGHSVEFLTHSHSFVPRQSVLRMFLTRNARGYFLAVKRKIEAFLSYPITSFADSFPTTKLLGSTADFQSQCSCYDAVIVGSDQMWNPKWVVPDFIPVVFLDLVNCKCKRISYAASFATSKWTGGYEDVVGALLKKFDAISVREKSAIKVVKDLSGMDAVHLVDPVMLNDRSLFEFSIESKMGPSNYIFRYMINGWIDDDVSIKIFRDLLKRYKADFICDDTCRSFGLFQRKIKVEEWLSRLRNAKIVITNSFHGVVFSLIFHKEFIVFPLEGGYSDMNERIYSLLDSFNINDRLVPRSYEGLKEKIACVKDIDWKKIDKKILELRRMADSFLSQCGI